MKTDFYISTDKQLLNTAFIHDYLTNKSYWAKDRKLSIVHKSIENSLCFGVYTRTGEQVGFARIV